MGKITKTTGIFDKVSGLIEQARKKIASTINEEMVILYWNIGKIIKEKIIKIVLKRNTKKLFFIHI